MVHLWDIYIYIYVSISHLFLKFVLICHILYQKITDITKIIDNVVSNAAFALTIHLVLVIWWLQKLL